MGEREMVEVIQPKNGTQPARRVENGPDVWLAEVYPNSLTAARLRLADAAEAREACEEMPGDTEEEIATAVQTWDVADDEYRAAYKAIAALRTARGA